MHENMDQHFSQENVCWKPIQYEQKCSNKNMHKYHGKQFLRSRWRGQRWEGNMATTRCQCTVRRESHPPTIIHNIYIANGRNILSYRQWATSLF